MENVFRFGKRWIVVDTVKVLTWRRRDCAAFSVKGRLDLGPGKRRINCPRGVLLGDGIVNHTDIATRDGGVDFRAIEVARITLYNLHVSALVSSNVDNNL